MCKVLISTHTTSKMVATFHLYQLILIICIFLSTSIVTPNMSMRRFRVWVASFIVLQNINDSSIIFFAFVLWHHTINWYTHIHYLISLWYQIFNILFIHTIVYNSLNYIYIYWCHPLCDFNFNPNTNIAIVYGFEFFSNTRTNLIC